MTDAILSSCLEISASAYLASLPTGDIEPISFLGVRMELCIGCGMRKIIDSSLASKLDLLVV